MTKPTHGDLASQIRREWPELVNAQNEWFALFKVIATDNDKLCETSGPPIRINCPIGALVFRPNPSIWLRRDQFLQLKSLLEKTPVEPEPKKVVKSRPGVLESMVADRLAHPSALFTKLNDNAYSFTATDEVIDAKRYHALVSIWVICEEKRQRRGTVEDYCAEYTKTGDVRELFEPLTDSPDYRFKPWGHGQDATITYQRVGRICVAHNTPIKRPRSKAQAEAIKQGVYPNRDEIKRNQLHHRASANDEAA